MRARIRSSVIVGVAMIGISALAIAPMAPPPEPHTPPTVSREVQLTAAPALGAIPLAFLRNQFQYCSLICPFAVQGAITVPIAAAQAPATFLGSLASTGSPLKAIGAAAASVTGPANAAVTPLINNDVFLVVPKAFHALDVAIVEAFNVGAAVFTPGELVQAVQNGRTNILNALNQPVGPPTTPTAPRTNCRSWRSRRSMSRRLWRSRPVNSCWRAWCKSPTLRRRNWRNRAIPRPRSRPELPRRARWCHGERARGLGGEHRGDEHSQFVGRSIPSRGEYDGTVDPSADGQDGRTEETGHAHHEEVVRKFQ